jgi:hypothetical protein
MPTMSANLCVLALLAALAAQPMVVDVQRGEDALVISFSLNQDLPESIEQTLSSGATVVLDYPLRVFARRRLLPDRKVWKGVARVTVNFDAVTGRYLCQLIVNGDTTASSEVHSVAAARAWLKSPPKVELDLPEARRDAVLRVRVRAVFASGTAWLVFPSTEGTDWFEVRLDPASDDSSD